MHRNTDNLEAYDYFLRGLEYHSRTTQETTAQARQMYEKAIALDPKYAAVYAGLSETYYLEWNWRWSTDPQTLERAFALAHQALALDPSNDISTWERTLRRRRHSLCDSWTLRRGGGSLAALP